MVPFYVWKTLVNFLEIEKYLEVARIKFERHLPYMSDFGSSSI